MMKDMRGKNYRITVLTSRLIRLEYSSTGQFVDGYTQLVTSRDFASPEYDVKYNGDCLEIETGDLHVYYDQKEFSPQGLKITLQKGFGIYGSTWKYGDKVRTLGGTARTLDNANGAVALEDGLLSREGYAILDDSKSAVITEDGWIRPREIDGIDIYFFGYGHDYLDCLKDFYHLCGKTPLLPRYTLGNWWSRFYPYQQDEYVSLMDRFAQEQIPIAVSVVDMDWHMTSLPEKYGSGWTGFSWNPELFPEPERFLQELHERGLHVTLNLHPADGVKGHETQYVPMAKALGVDYKNEERIPFEVTNPKFMDAYFKYLLHPLEEQGVDFWWMDWQQGTTSEIPGIDPLWMLNYLHYKDSCRNGNRGLTFSRYAGIGSHRYPVGFSGDTVNSWESLDFQPYFTATASNAGYSWWSHDIGGHMMGEKNDELATRWVQFGVFSPIMRLHSTSNPFYGKEPWNFGTDANRIMQDFMRLRHRLIPYLYTANYETSEQGIPLMQPLYYHNDCDEAYRHGNEYYFGSQLLVCPITKPQNQKTCLAKTDIYLPQGIWYDFFTHDVYEGNRTMEMYRTLDSIPVMAKAGAIIPLAEDYSRAHLHNPKYLELQVFHGADGQYTMIEDDCSDQKLQQSRYQTEFVYRCDPEESVLTMHRTGNHFPDEMNHRVYKIRIIGVSNPTAVRVNQTLRKEGIDYFYDEKLSQLLLTIQEPDCDQFEIALTLLDGQVQKPDARAEIFDRLNRMQISYDLKARIYEIVCASAPLSERMRRLHDLRIDADISGAIFELLYM